MDSAGLPPAGVELRIADLESGEVLAPGEVGEIQVLSPSVMAGYLPDEATAEAFADGWYRTGDVGWLEPEGWVHLTDRSKEMIKVSGFQVAPAEVEAVLYRHPAVLDCAVFGVPDARAGEVPVAAVKLDPDQPLADGELEQLVADSLATYKQLRRVVIVDEIPRLPSGKVLRRTLRDEWSPQPVARAGRLMDVRLSQEQQALRDAAAQVVDRLGPKAVAEIGDPRRAAKLDAAVTESGWRDLRVAAEGGGPLASGVEAAIVAEELGRGVGRRVVPRADTGRGAEKAGGRAARRHGRDSGSGRAASSSLVRGVDGTCPPAVAIDAQGSDRALLLAHGPEGGRSGPGRAACAAVGSRPHPSLRGPRRRRRSRRSKEPSGP